LRAPIQIFVHFPEILYAWNRHPLPSKLRGSGTVVPRATPRANRGPSDDQGGNDSLSITHAKLDAIPTGAAACSLRSKGPVGDWPGAVAEPLQCIASQMCDGGNLVATR
jgi:hypothetical protein